MSRKNTFVLIVSLVFFFSSGDLLADDAGEAAGFELKSTRRAFYLASGPIAVATLTGYGLGPLLKVLGAEEQNAENVAGICALTIFFLGSIPAHIYVEHSVLRTSLFTSAKLGTAALMAGGVAIMFEKSFMTSDDPPGYSVLMFLTGLIGLAGSTFYEIGAIYDTAKRYNKEIEQESGLQIHPIAWRDRFGLGIQMRF